MKQLFVFALALLTLTQSTFAASRQIVVGRQATSIEQLAAKELQRYLWEVTGTFLEIKASDEVTPGSFLLGQRETNPLIEKLTIGDLGAQGYVLKTTVVGDKPVVVIAGGDAVGCLYGVYGLLEDHFGLTFSLAQDVLPDERKSLDLPPLDERHAPSVGVRGILPWSNWPQTTTSYSWADWKSVIDQMAKMRMNLLMVHNYADELYHNVPIDGKLPRVSLPHTKTGYMIGHPAWVPWAYRFKGRDLIDDCSFGAESSLHSESFSNEEAYSRGVAMFRRVIAYAHTRGVRIALGVDVNDTVKGKGKFNDAQRAKFAHDPAFVKARVDQLISDYPELDYFVAFCSEGIPQFKDTAPEWNRTIRYIHQEFKKRAPGIKLAVAGWGMRNEYIEGLPEDVIIAPIAPYKAAAQDGAIAGKRDFWAGPWMEKDNDDSMFYMPYRVLLSATIESWQKRFANTKGLYALTWRNTDAIDAKFWYLAHAPWDAQNKLKTARDAYHAYAVANYGREAADAVTPIINENEAFASNMCEMGGPRPFREFATIMSARHEVNIRSFRIPAVGFQVEAVKYHHRTGGGPVKAGTPNAYMQMTSGLCLEFRNVDFGEGANEIHAELASVDGARVEFRLDNADGPLLGQGVVPKTKTGEDFKTVIVPIKPTKGKQIVVINFSKEIYPRKELAKAEEQIAIVDRCMAKASPGQRQRLDLLRTRLAAVRDHIRLNLEFPEYKLADLPGAMESWVMNYIRRVDDISSLGMMTSIQNRLAQYTYLRNKVEPFYERQAIRPPLDVEARGTAQGAEITWRETDSSGKVRGYRVYRDGQLLTQTDLPVTADKFMDEGSGEFNYTVTAVGADGKESLSSVKSRCLAGSADKEPPFIVMVSPPLSGLRGQPVVVKARVIDNRSYDSISATLYYRQFGSHDWQSLPMTRRVRAIFTATLTPVAGLEYYIEASDGSNTGRFPLAAPNRNLSVILETGPTPVELATPQAKATQRALTWTETPNAYWYRIYRGRTADFKAGPESYLTYAPKRATTFTDMEEDFDGRPREATYYYRVTAMDANGYESVPSDAVPIRSRIILPLRSATVQGRPQLLKLPDALTTMGFVLANFGKQSGDQILFKNVPSATGLRIRYSNGNSQPTQCGLYVGEKRVATLTFPVTMRSDDADNYADGKRLTTAKGAKGDWNSFSVLDVNLPIAGQIVFRIDGNDFKANSGEACCYLDRIELTPSADVMPVPQQNGVKMQAEPFESHFAVRTPGISIGLNEQGQIVSCWLGDVVAMTGRTELAGCKTDGAATGEKLADGGWVFSRRVKDGRGNSCAVRESFVPAGNSIRWAVELVSTNSPWTTEIALALKYPATAQTRFWTAWMNGVAPDGTMTDGKQWGDPLVALPMMNQAWGYGVGLGSICLPIASFLEPGTDRGLSLVVSPEQALIKLQLATTADGGARFMHRNLRLGDGNKVVVSADLTGHEADWRGGLRWMVERYRQFFDPPNPRAAELAGTASYSNWRRPFRPEEVERLKKMAYRTQWVATFDWPYYVMYMPPMPNDDACWETCGHDSSGRSTPNPKRVRKVSCRLMNEECQNFKNAGFFALSYFMLNEFGSDIVGPEKVKKELPESESWKDANTMLYRNFPGAIVFNAEGKMLPKSWSRSVVMDPGEPNFHKFILEQARLTAERLPDSAGIAIDRMDRLTLVNFAPGADDQVGWYANGRPGRDQGIAWQQIMAKIGPMFHDRGKFIVGSPAGWGYHLEWFRELDGIYDEFGYRGGIANADALIGLRKPVLLWTENQHVRKASPDDMTPDLFFQRHLYLGAYPSVPLEENDHMIRPEPKADQYYLDYGPLMDAYRGKKWVLAPHCVEVAGNAAKVNLFEVPGGYAMPVTFGGMNKTATVTVRNVQNLERARCAALHPGAEKPVTLVPTYRDGVLRLEVPLQRGCALVQIRN